ncbi:MAG: hypothetical protein WCO98_06780 [bacterium]
MSDELAKKILVEVTRCVNDRNWDLAVNAFERLARIRPLDPKVIYNKGVAYTRLLRFSEAKADFVRAIELENNYPLARNSYREICIELSEIPNPLLMPTEEPVKVVENEIPVIQESEIPPVIPIVEEPAVENIPAVENDTAVIDWDKFEESGAITIGSPTTNNEPYVENTPALEIPQVMIPTEPEFNIFDDGGIGTSNSIASFEGESSFIFNNEDDDVIIDKKEPINDFVISTSNGISFDLNDDDLATPEPEEFKTPLETNNLDFLPSENELTSSIPFNPNIPEPEEFDFKTPLETVNLDFIPIAPEKTKKEPLITPFQFEEAPAPLQINDNDDDDDNEGKGRKIIFDLDA